MDDRLTTYVTADGLVLHLHPVRGVAVARRKLMIEEQMRSSGAPVDPPTRVSIALGGHGDAETIPLTADTLESDDPQQTARNKALWKAHQDALAKLMTLQGEESVTTFLALGVDIEGGTPPVEEWASQLDYLGVTLPENPFEQKAYYLMFVALNDFDLGVIISQIQMLGAGKAVTAEQVASFQETVQSQMGEAIDALVRSARTRLERSRARLERASETGGDENGKGVAIAA